MQAFLNDGKLGEITKKINYLFAVIREEMKEYKEAVYNVIRNIKD